MEKKIELECDYCGVPITEKDHKCPNCGANCTEKIKKYQEQENKEKERIRQENIEQSKKIQEDFNKPVKFVFAIAAAIIIFTFVMFFITIFGSHKGSIINEEKEIEKEGIVCKQDSYELYTYVSEKFPEHYNTPEGYQKIAFHIICENKGDTEDMVTGFDIKLTADDYSVKYADIKAGTFEKAVLGKAEYPSILNEDIAPGEKLQGYIGYAVPKDKKVLKLTVKGKTTTLDNPVYEGE